MDRLKAWLGPLLEAKPLLLLAALGLTVWLSCVWTLARNDIDNLFQCRLEMNDVTWRLRFSADFEIKDKNIEQAILQSIQRHEAKQTDI